MSNFSKLFNSDLNVINLGLKTFANNLQSQGVSTTNVDWKPHIYSKSKVKDYCNLILESPFHHEIQKANQYAVERMMNAQPTIMGIGRAIDDIPGMRKNLFLHAGPPIEWERMSGPLKGGIIGGIIYEKMASTPEEAERIAASGQIDFEPCHHHSTVGPMAGIVTPSMPVWKILNETAGNFAYATLNEGLGKVLRYGAYAPEVIDRLNWMEHNLAHVVSKLIGRHGPVDLKTLIAQALQMGDEGHNRNRAGTSLLIREFAAHIIQVDASEKDKLDAMNFINSNDHFFLNLTMPASKSVMDSVMGIENTTLIAIMARNGTDFGVKLSSIPDEWFVAPALDVDGLFFPPYTEADANPDIGDSVITETAGIGGFAMASAPAIVQFVGGSPDDALRFTQEMYDITITENTTYKIPIFNFRGTPTGIDVLKVIDTGILPAINTGIAHKEPGIGMVGAGLVKPPAKCFEDALNAFYHKYQDRF
jgi:hypothetical protein